MSNPGTLYCIATPIGNPGDITLRAVETLRLVDLVACEDTRSAGLLLKHLGIEKKPMISLFEHNEERKVNGLVAALREGRSVGLVSEAGTPTVSDPGYRLIHRCVEEELPVVPIPGVCAAVAALSVSGLPTDRFLFLGFPPKKGKRLAQFVMWATVPGQTSVVYLPTRRLAEFMAAVEEQAPDTRIVIARELTKTYEEFLRGTPGELLQQVQQRDLKGECTLVLHREGKVRRQDPYSMDPMEESESPDHPE
jgi:16S rRNA (cytidine1402-2'-O)-methyltransferase